MSAKEKREKRLNLVGICCGLFVAIVIIASGVVKSMPKTTGVKAGDIPADAQTLTASAPGKIGDVTVEIIADANKLYQIKVLEHTETEGIGTLAVEQLPGAIFDAQSLKVDSVSGATVTSEAIKTAIVNALESGGLSAAPFGG